MLRGKLSTLCHFIINKNSDNKLDSTISRKREKREKEKKEKKRERERERQREKERERNYCTDLCVGGKIATDVRGLLFYKALDPFLLYY